MMAGSQRRDRREGAVWGMGLLFPETGVGGAVRMQRGNGIRKHLHLPAHSSLSCPLPCPLRSLHSDWSRRPHDAGGLPGLLWGCAGVPVHAGIGECPLCAHRPWSPRSPTQDPIDQGAGRGRAGAQDPESSRCPVMTRCSSSFLEPLSYHFP